jgi:hypothetical protein
MKYPVRVLKKFDEESGTYRYIVQKKDYLLMVFDGVDYEYGWRQIREFDFEDSAIRHAQKIKSAVPSEVIYTVP